MPRKKWTLRLPETRDGVKNRHESVRRYIIVPGGEDFLKQTWVWNSAVQKSMFIADALQIPRRDAITLAIEAFVKFATVARDSFDDPVERITYMDTIVEVLSHPSKELLDKLVAEVNAKYQEYITGGGII